MKTKENKEIKQTVKIMGEIKIIKICNFDNDLIKLFCFTNSSKSNGYKVYNRLLRIKKALLEELTGSINEILETYKAINK